MPLLQSLELQGLDYNNVILLLIEVFKVLGVALGIILAYRANQNAKTAAQAASGAKASSENNAIQLTETKERVAEIKHQTDGITSKLVEATRQMGEAQAVAARYEGKEEERNHNAEVAAHVADTALKAVAVAAAAVPPGAVMVNNAHPVAPAPPKPPGEDQ